MERSGLEMEVSTVIGLMILVIVFTIVVVVLASGYAWPTIRSLAELVTFDLGAGG